MSKNERNVNVHNWFVVSTHLKNICQNGNLPQIQIGVKIKYLKPPPKQRCNIPGTPKKQFLQVGWKLWWFPTVFYRFGNHPPGAAMRLHQRRQSLGVGSQGSWQLVTKARGENNNYLEVGNYKTIRLGFQVAIYPSTQTSWDLVFRVCVWAGNCGGDVSYLLPIYCRWLLHKINSPHITVVFHPLQKP